MKGNQVLVQVYRCCIDNIFTLNELIQGRLKDGKKTFYDIQIAYDSVWDNSLWLKLWNMGMKGKMWRVIKIMYNHYLTFNMNVHVRLFCVNSGSFY